MRLAVTEYEKELIERKMQQLGTKNFGAYARKMLVDGYIIKVDYTQQKKLAAAVSRVASNINQILPPHQLHWTLLCGRYCRTERKAG